MATWIKLTDNLGEIKYLNIEQACKITIRPLDMKTSSISFYFGDNNHITMECTYEFRKKIETTIGQKLIFDASEQHWWNS